jgi:hypothetical protein
MLRSHEIGFAVDSEDLRTLLNAYAKKFTSRGSEQSLSLEALHYMSGKLFVDITPEFGGLASQFINAECTQIWRVLENWSTDKFLSFLSFTDMVLKQTR